MPRDLFHRVANRGLLSALSNLSQSLTINGVTEAPTFRYEGKDAGASSWAAVVGHPCAIFDAAGAAPTLDVETPLIKSTDRAVKFHGTGADYYKHNGTPSGYGSVGGDDCVFELVFSTPITAQLRIANTRSSQGWILQTLVTGYISAYMDGADSAVSVSGAVGDLAANAWYHAMMFYDKSGFARWYLNAQESGSAANVSGVGVMTSDNALTLGGTSTWDGSLALFQMWQRENWLDSHLQPTIVAARAKALFGSNTDETRDSVAYLHKPVSDAKKYFLVGKNWMRTSKDLTGGAYYQKEAAATNLEEEPTNDLSGWTDVTGLTTSFVDSPLTGQSATKLTEDAGTSEHRIKSTAVPVGSDTYTLSYMAKPAGRTHFYSWLNQAAADDFGLRVELSGAGTLGASTPGANWSNTSASIEVLGNGWYRVQLSGTHTGSTNLETRINVLTAIDGAVTYVGNSSDAVSICNVQLEQSAGATSPIDNLTTSPTTRAADA